MEALVARPTIAALTAATASLVAATASAHDYVLWPEPARLTAPGSATLRLRVGDHLAFELERGFVRGDVARFTHRTAAGERDLLADRGPDGPPPYARVALGAGGHLFALDRPATRIELAPAKFERYLRHEHLDAVVADRARRGESNRPGRERYARYLKTFVQVGPAADGAGLAPTGQALEIVLGADPATARVGTPIPFTLREDGAPVPGHVIEALHRGPAGLRTLEIRTDDAGHGRLRPDRPGRWVLRTITMRRCANDCEDVDWESRWTSFAFHVADG